MIDSETDSATDPMKAAVNTRLNAPVNVLVTVPPGPRQRGSSSVEYVLLTTMVVGVLFLPLPGLGESLVDTLVSALRQFQANTTYLLSLP